MIVDDEEVAQKSLQLIISTYFNTQLSVVKMASSVEEAAIYLSNNNIDILFLDIDMPEKNGFELLKQLPNLSCSVVFTTAYEQYAMQAIKSSALDYLLKPINIQELKEAIDKHIKNKENNVPSVINVEALINTLISSEKITITTSTGLEVIRITDIVSMLAQGNNTLLYLLNGTTVTCTKQLGQLHKLVSPLFFRIHKSHAINLSLVKQYNKQTGQVIMVTLQSLTVSTEVKSQFLQLVKNNFKP
jgi:two-component system LytT family response regulator